MILLTLDEAYQMDAVLANLKVQVRAHLVRTSMPATRWAQEVFVVDSFMAWAATSCA